MSSSPDSPTPPEVASLLARGQSLEAQATPESLTEAVRAYEAAITLLRTLPASDLAVRRDLAVAHMNRGNALQKSDSAESIQSAVKAYDEAIVLLGSPPLNTILAALNTLGAAWMNRGHALHRLGTPDSMIAAAESHRTAINVLQSLPIVPSENVPPEAAFNHRLNLAGACVNLANTLLGSEAISNRHAVAREAALHALSLVNIQELVEGHPVAAELSLLSRRAAIDALGHLIFAAGDSAASQELASEAGDLVDDGLALVRHWEQRDVPHFRPLGHRLYHFGAQLYRINQPHFLAEFLFEHLESPGSTPADPVLQATAADAITAALKPLRAVRVVRAEDPGTLRQVETLRSLQAAEQRLAELRQAHPAPPPTTTA